MKFNITDERDTKCKTTIKTVVLDSEFHERNTINIDETNLDQKLECAENVNFVMEENDEFKELQKPEDVCVKSENCMDRSGLDEKKCRSRNIKCEPGIETYILDCELQPGKVHTGKQNYKCPICEKLFTLRKSVTRHMVVHTGEKDFKCDICQKSFYRAQNLQCHMLIHSGVKNFKCDFCAKPFSQKSCLYRHLHLHTKPSLKQHLKVHCIKNFKIDKKREIKCEAGIEMDVLDYEPHEQNNINTDETNLDHKSETAEKVNCVKEENDQFEEELHELEDICVKSENCMDSSSLDEKKCISGDIKCEAGIEMDVLDCEPQSVKVHTGKQNHKCPICKKLFTLRKSVTRHMLVHTEEKNFKCEICPKAYYHKNDLNQHLLSHTGEKNFRCDICKKSFYRTQHLQSHMLIHSAVKNFKCDFCAKPFSQKSCLYRHLHLHTGVKNYKCGICDKAFIQKRQLTNHSRLHKPENKYKCNLCEKSFTLKCFLEQHLTVHTRVKFKCDICEKLLTTKPSLKRHLKVHLIKDVKSDKKREINCEAGIETDVLDYETPEPNNINTDETNLDHKSEIAEKVNCVKEENDQFEEKLHELEGIYLKSENCIDNDEKKHSTLQQHVKVHNCPIGKESFAQKVNLYTGEKKYKCDICAKSFALKETLNKHLLLHTGDKKYKCDICKKSFIRKGILNQHLLLHTAEKHNCDICKKSFTRKGYLKQHLLLHTGVKNYECDICEKSFSLNSSKKKHMLVHTGKKNFKCTICDKSFFQISHLKTHLLLHAGVKNYKCSICDKAFTQKAHLKYHSVLHNPEKNYV